MELSDLLNFDESNGWFEQGFRQVIEDHLSLIKTVAIVNTASVAPMIALRFQGDFFGLLKELQIPEYMHWITMRVNNLRAPADSPKDLTAVQVVDINYIRRLYNTHRTHMKTKKATVFK